MWSLHPKILLLAYEAFLAGSLELIMMITRSWLLLILLEKLRDCLKHEHASEMRWSFFHLSFLLY
ncbi:hypothetical protein Hanom_Chr10g00909441 [Helianthus anomalus]